jgi:hypothetical protein
MTYYAPEICPFTTRINAKPCFKCGRAVAERKKHRPRGGGPIPVAKHPRARGPVRFPAGTYFFPIIGCVYECMRLSGDPGGPESNPSALGYRFPFMIFSQLARAVIKNIIYESTLYRPMGPRSGPKGGRGNRATRHFDCHVPVFD